MPKIPITSGRKLVKVFEYIGYEVARQKGSHIRLANKSNPALPPITIPDHREVSIGVMRKLIRDTKIDINELIILLRN
ncbi:addiction module toxin, HicA family [Candidatus Berkelbacteria bacterium]|uniref:Type II toxin-antitoxin system HicA family toxin n=1 Tax=Candidatus Berkelbacteria bacterium CG10_big_fil_rev_8_21_14_0_10_43_14 TaxID=1974515 RepID=A0A2M6R821_9BACT|nr:addiction module toxin, HicA family [Candidatus Berkelbacteria bacterium]OIP07019.1 MAG: hypothetical protein AUK41_00830 [Candidatus Berkelbacteria bacterium CG2_30_43_20]PIS06647.1 MAG: hypothetical protein COT79_03530 [Candidatus Berkelbacteria bacterium CG10_big_fil_rev_8_21_14_0_10_43_14]PIU86957.1 MAG: hypothetical protein COS66_03420 [Candidatus Berkelbacteria bacterium CG06_land_8_20_14_3_00_43_10]